VAEVARPEAEHADPNAPAAPIREP
jgi:hypothetical protein